MGTGEMRSRPTNLFSKKITRALVALALVGSVSADDHGFPDDSSFHASCHLSTTLTGTSCADAKAKADDLIKNNVDTDSEYKGTMGIHSEGDDWIWSTRLTYNKKYTDDQLFEFVTSGSDCTVNCCNMWNVVSRIDGFSTASASHCKTTPSDPAT